MGKQRKNYTGQFKAKVVLEVLKGEMTTQQIAKKFGVHPQMLTQWKKKALEGLPQVMSDKRNKDEQEQEDLTNQLYQQIGQLKVELDWLKKKSGLF